MKCGWKLHPAPFQPLLCSWDGKGKRQAWWELESHGGAFSSHLQAEDWWGASGG